MSIIDANNTPRSYLDRVWASEELELYARGFSEAFLAQQAVPGSTSTGCGELAPTIGVHSPEEAGMMSRIEAQSGRIALLETVVGELGAAVVRFFAEFSAAPLNPRRKKRKRRKA